MAKKMKRYIPLIISLIIILIAVAVLFIRPYVKYTIACKNEAQGNYSDAITIFEGLENYKDAPMNVERCKYEWALTLLNTPTDEHYEKAIELLKGIPQYADSTDKCNEAVLSYANSLRTRLKFEEAIAILETVDSTSEVIEARNAAKYAYALQLFKTGELARAKDFLGQVGNYESSKEHLEKIDFLLSIQGEYQGNRSYMKATIAGYTFYDILETSNGTYVYDFKIDEDTIDPSGKTFQAAGSEYLVLESKYYGIVLQERCDGQWEAEYRRVNTETAIPVTELKKEPALGMTADEVKNSTWGEPKDINRTITQYGVTEQWVYPDYKYIYFDNGVVTAIQD